MTKELQGLVDALRVMCFTIVNEELYGDKEVRCGDCGETLEDCDRLAEGQCWGGNGRAALEAWERRPSPDEKEARMLGGEVLFHLNENAPDAWPHVTAKAAMAIGVALQEYVLGAAPPVGTTTAPAPPTTGASLGTDPGATPPGGGPPR